MSSKKEERRAKLEAERVWLRAQLEDLEQDWRRIPWAFATAALGLPIGWIWGASLGVIALVFGLGFGATAAYLIGVRRQDYQRRMADVERELRALGPREPAAEIPDRG
ncbi:MAG: hypothetical protein OEY14_02320 [Myxococcales bacterium]|nr:hypothetical protein [Myxococcales bacterium]